MPPPPRPPPPARPPPPKVEAVSEDAPAPADDTAGGDVGTSAPAPEATPSPSEPAAAGDAISSDTCAGWFVKVGEGKSAKSRRRYFVLDKSAGTIKYFENEGENGEGKKLKGEIKLSKAEKIVLDDPKLLIHTPERLWDLKAEAPGQVDKWGEMFTTFMDIPITGQKVQRNSMADMMDTLGPASPQKKKCGLFDDRIEVRSVTLQRDSKEARYGVQFAPYEGTANGVMICGVSAGGSGDGVVRIREKVIGINGKPCDGLTYPEAVQLMRTIVDGTWSVLNLDVEYRELYGIVGHDYEATTDSELGLKVGERIRIISEEENGWRRGMIEDRSGWFPSTYVEMEPEPELEEWMPKVAVADEPEAPIMPKRNKPFPAAKIWNHGRISRAQVEERLKEYSGNKEDGIFLARQKDPSTFSVGFQVPGEPQPKFVLFEKKDAKWYADKNYEQPRGDSLAASVEEVITDMGICNADGVPKPE